MDGRIGEGVASTFYYRWTVRELTQVLYSSYGFAIPEHCWFAAVQGRKALGSVLDELVERGAIGDDEAVMMAEQIPRGSARRLDELDEL